MGFFKKRQKKLSSSDLDNLTSDLDMITNEQALDLIKSKHISTVEVAAKFYGLSADADSKEKTYHGKLLRDRRVFNNAELQQLHKIIKEELNGIGISASFFLS